MNEQQKADRAARACGEYMKICKKFGAERRMTKHARVTMTDQERIEHIKNLAEKHNVSQNFLQLVLLSKYHRK